MVAHGTEVSKVRSAYLRTRAKDVVAIFGGGTKMDEHGVGLANASYRQ